MEQPKLPTTVKPIEWIGPGHPAFTETGLIHYAHIPKEATITDPAPIVVMVHGRAGDESVMWIFKQAIPKGVAIVSPRAPIAESEDAFAWFDSSQGTLHPTNESLESSLTKFQVFIESLPYIYSIDPSRLVLMGFSQGAAICNAFTFRNPGAVIGVASLAGSMIQPIDSSSPAGSVENLPVLIAHGVSDDTIPLEYAHKTRDRYLELGADVTYGEYSTGHKMTMQAINDLKAWLSERLSGDEA